MRLLITSDTHGDILALRHARNAQPSADVVFHLGDGFREARAMQNEDSGVLWIQVRGNCDWMYAAAPEEQLCTLGGVRIMAVHGHTYQVKSGTGAVTAAAREKGVGLLLFGHTHTPYAAYRDGLYILNPGSLCRYGTYGIVDITSAGIVTNIIKL